MSAPSIISDAQAREIAQFYLTSSWPALRLFVATGEITPSLFREAQRRGPGGVSDLAPLYYYVAHHGERSPVAGWSEL